MDNKKYNDKVKVKFLELNTYPTVSHENIEVVDCFINQADKENHDKGNYQYYYEPTKQLEDSIRDEVLKIKDKKIQILLLRIHSLFDNASNMHNNMDIRKKYIEEHMHHSIKVYLFDNIETSFYRLI